MRNIITKSYAKTLMLLLSAPLLLTNCSIYSGTFACEDSKGAHCVMLSEVDKMIDSGAIEEFYRVKKCKKSKCSNEINEPRLRNAKTSRALVTKPEIETEADYRYGDYLYVK